MSAFKIFKETTLPSTLSPHAIYLVSPASNSNYVELYVTDSNGAARRHFNESDARTLVQNLMSGVGKLTVVNDIAARDALKNVENGNEVYVINASADSTVSSGGARYLRQGTSWIKTAETESMDLVLNWNNIIGKPSSTPAKIDAAVTASHTHANKTKLDKIGEDSDGNLTYAGNPVATAWSITNW